MKNQNVTNACKNAIGTMFLLAGAFFICSTLLSMRTVLADPIAPVNATQSRLAPARTAPGRTRANTRTTASRSVSARGTTARTATSRATVVQGETKQTTAPRNIKTRSVSIRNVNENVVSTPVAERSVGTATRSIVARNNANNTTMRGTAARNGQRVVARTATSAPRVGVIGSGMRATFGSSSGLNVTYLTGKLYTGNYSNIIDSTTGMISADAYSTCLESYYTCMDEICTARSSAKGRCSCAGRATNFLAAETALEKANEELIQLSGQLALLVATKGKDVSEAFKLTDAEKVMNCVSYRENVTTGKQDASSWYEEHPTWTSNNTLQTSGTPAYCENNNFGFDIDELDGSGSDILASLKAWADAKDLAKDFVKNDNTNLLEQYGAISGVVNGLSGVTTTDLDQADLDTLANKWGYKLFEYAHNNVCGRVLDTCFNGIYEACGTPPEGKDSMGNKIGKCANGATTQCPYNYNSAISVKITSNDDSTGEVVLNERGSTTSSSTAACFGYSTTTTGSTSDPYESLRGPVADARRSIMQKYLLDANAACDVYGTSLKNTAQNINYQKIAAEQALRQKRLDFYNEEQTKIKNDAVAAITNFNECISELWDCYTENEDQETWTTARIKTYCAQVSNAPHCYETMICDMSPLMANAVIDVEDKPGCSFDLDHTKNTCRNVVSLNEILYRASSTGVGATDDVLLQMARSEITHESTEVREACLQKALGCSTSNTDPQSCLRTWKKPQATTDD